MNNSKFDYDTISGFKIFTFVILWSDALILASQPPGSFCAYYAFPSEINTIFLFLFLLFF